MLNVLLPLPGFLLFLLHAVKSILSGGGGGGGRLSLFEMKYSVLIIVLCSRAIFWLCTFGVEWENTFQVVCLFALFTDLSDISHCMSSCFWAYLLVWWTTRCFAPSYYFAYFSSFFLFLFLFLFLCGHVLTVQRLSMRRSHTWQSYSWWDQWQLWYVAICSPLPANAWWPEFVFR